MKNDAKEKSRVRLRRWCCAALLITALCAGGWWVHHEFSRVRNRSVECAILGEARQICSASNQIFQEQSRDSVQFKELAKCLGPDGRMSSGLVVSSNGTQFYGPLYSGVPGVLTKGGVFFIRSQAWSSELSRVQIFKDMAVDEHTLKFSVDTGAPMP